MYLITYKCRRWVCRHSWKLAAGHAGDAEDHPECPRCNSEKSSDIVTAEYIGPENRRKQNE